MPKITRGKSAKQLHSQRLKQIRPFVSFNYDLRKPLSTSAKKKIKKYHDEITALTNRPFQVYRARNSDHLRDAQKFAQHEKDLPELRVAFLPTDGTNKMQLRFTKSGVKGKTKNVVMSDVLLSVRKLLADPEGHVNERIRFNPAKQFTIQAGRYEIPRPFLPQTVGKAVARLVARYSDEEQNNFFGNWLHGLKAYEFDGQATLAEYLQEKQRVIRKNKRERKNARRRAERAREKQSS